MSFLVLKFVCLKHGDRRVNNGKVFVGVRRLDVQSFPLPVTVHR